MAEQSIRNRQIGRSSRPLRANIPTLFSRLGVAALTWDRRRRETVALLAERAALSCEYERNDYSGDEGPEVIRGACWKGWMQESYDGGRFVRRPQDEWCDRCRRRQEIHERYRVLVLQRGAALRQIQRLAAQLDAVEGISEEAGS